MRMSRPFESFDEEVEIIRRERKRLKELKEGDYIEVTDGINKGLKGRVGDKVLGQGKLSSLPLIKIETPEGETKYIPSDQIVRKSLLENKIERALSHRTILEKVRDYFKSIIL